MQTVTATDFARNFRTMLDRIEFRREELLIVRNNHPVARVTPGPAVMTAMEACADLYNILPTGAGKDWLTDSRLDDAHDREVINPWES